MTSADEDLGAVVGGRPHPVDLLLCHRNDLVIARQGDEPIVRREQQRDAVVGEQRRGVALASPARRKGVEVLTKPPAHVAAVHGHGPYRRRAVAARAHTHASVRLTAKRGVLVGRVAARAW